MCGFQAATAFALSALVDPGMETEVVRPITRDNQTPDNLFSIEDAGPCKWLDRYVG